MDLSDVLLPAGFRRIQLSRSGVGHFHTPASVAGRPVSALLDTGGSTSVLSLALAQEMGLDLVLTDDRGGGAGGAQMDVFLVQDADVRLDDMTTRLSALAAMDLSHANQALIDNGESPIELIIGVDVFTAHDAIIDYGTSSLFMKP